MNLWIIFLTGLTTGGLACLAMQGGLLASVITNQKEQDLTGSDWLPVSMFLVAKLVSHTILGFLLGALGSVISLSLGVSLAFQAFAAFFMFATAMNLLQVHPFFRFVMFEPPKFMQRWIHNSSRSKAVFAPAVLGAMTIFIPCGVTQAMEILAINTGSPVQGALIMFTFVLGTVPLFAFIGVATAKLSENWHDKFTKIAAVVLIIMAISGINGILTVLDSPLTIQKITRPVTYFFSDERFENTGSVSVATTSGDTVPVVAGVQQVNLEVENYGYSPNYVKVAAGVPVSLTLTTNDTYSCASFFTFKAFNITARLAPTDSQTFTFTPEKTGRYTFTCSMGMYSGIMEVI